MSLLCISRRSVLPTVLCAICLCIFPTVGWTESAAPGAEMQRLTDLLLIDAVRNALSHQPDVFIAQEAASYQKGAYIETGGEFDLTGEAALGYEQNQTSLGAQAIEEWTVLEEDRDAFNMGVGLHKKLRTGQTLSLEVAASQADAKIEGIPQTGPDSIGQVFFSVIQPLGKGRGQEGADAVEESAKRQSEAAFHEMLHVLCRKATEAAVAYWGYLSATRQLKILEEAEARSRALTEQISTLIAKEELPAAEITQARANLADTQRVRLQGDQALFESRQQLLLAMGIEGRRLAAAVFCRDDFPSAPGEKAMRSFDLQALVSIALKSRSDYRAQEWVEYAREVNLKGVERNMAPLVDLKLKAGYAGYDAGSGVDAFRRSFVENVPGASVSMQIVASWPFSNSTMKGRLAQARSLLKQARWEREKLDRQIRSDLMTAWSQLKSKSAALSAAEIARDNYTAALANEKRKYLLGMSTLTNVLTVENQLTQAQLNAVLAQTEVAIALVMLRFQSGTLLSADGDWMTVREEDLVSLPTKEMHAGNRLPERAPLGEGEHPW